MLLCRRRLDRKRRLGFKEIFVFIERKNINSQDFNLIGKTSGASFTGTTTHNITNVNALLGPLANNGGLTQTHALLPGSPAINAGTDVTTLNGAIDNSTTSVAVTDGTSIPAGVGFLIQIDSEQMSVTSKSTNTLTVARGANNTTTASHSNGAAVNPAFDQRGVGFPRKFGSAIDIGAFESRGFTIAATNGTPQNATINSAFAAPIVATVSSAFGEPIAGGLVTFTAPASGASGAFTGGVLMAAVNTDGSGIATAPTFTANLIGGTYNVIASIGTSLPTASFALTNNKAATTTALGASPNPSNLNQNVTFTATVTSASGTPTGTVTFKDGGAAISCTNAGGQTLNGSGVATCQTSSLTAGLHTITADYSGDAGFLASTGTLSGGQQVGSIIKFSASNYNTTEGSGFTTITVQRIGDLSAAVTVDYATPDDSAAMTFIPCSTANGIASPRCDFTTALGTLRWAAGDGADKTFTILINQDTFVEGPETATLTLSNLTGGAGFTVPGATSTTATLNIADDDLTPSATNPIDDPQNFVRQHYHDFLNREADTTGLNFWTKSITDCGSNQPCIDMMRVNVSAAFFLSIEFQNTGFFVERMYKAGFGDINPPTVPVPVRFTDFIRDAQTVGAGLIVGQGNWQMQLDNNKSAFALAFVQRQRFVIAFQNATTAAQFVDALFANAGFAPSASDRQAAIDAYNSGANLAASRAAALRNVADNQTLQQREFNRAFVLMEYFGYLRRNPDAAPEKNLNFDGYNFWLTKLNQFNGDFTKAEMVRAFLNSTEYRQRFGSQ